MRRWLILGTLAAGGPVAAGPPGRAVEVGETVIFEGDDQLIDMVDGPVASDEAVAQRFFEHYPDEFDALVVFATFRDVEPARAHFAGARRDVLGLGRAPYDESMRFGSAGRLLGVASMKTEYMDPYGDLYPVLAQEFGHAWLAFMRFLDEFGDPSYAMLDDQLWHWNELVHTDASVLGGNAWSDNSDGTFTLSGRTTRYSPLDLYGMGLLLPGDVAPWFVLDGATTLDDAPVEPNVWLPIGTTIRGDRIDITIDDVIAAEGPRIPDASSAQQDFRLAFALLTKPGERLEDVIAVAERVDEVRATWEQVFSEMTGGRGSMCTRLSAPCGDAGALPVAAHIEDAGGTTKDYVDPGERAFLVVDLRNDGNQLAMAVAVAAVADSDVAAEGPATVQTIAPGASGTARLPLLVSDDAACGTSAMLVVEATTGKRTGGNVFPVEIGRTALYRYEFEEEMDGWTVDPYGTDTPGDGAFVRVQPAAGGVQAPIDHTRDGRYAWVTGTGTEPGYRNDVDGVSTLLSPRLDVSRRTEPVLRFAYWVHASAYMRDVSAEDDLLVEASNDDGATWVELARLYDQALTWKRHEVRIADYLEPSAAMRLRFTARDRGPDNTVEVALDDVEILVPTLACGGSIIEALPPTPDDGCGCAAGRAPARRSLPLMCLLLLWALSRSRTTLLEEVSPDRGCAAMSGMAIARPPTARYGSLDQDHASARGAPLAMSGSRPYTDLACATNPSVGE